jgi:hypothetical protein
VGITLGDPLWRRELAKAANRTTTTEDPIKEHFQRTQMMERVRKE